MNSNKKMISFEIADELREKIRKEAYEKKTTLSGAVRLILEEYFKKKED